MENYNSLQIREIFHLEFLRWLGRELKLNYYVLKGGGNLRFFFNSFRYSEDIDFDVNTIKVEALKDVVMEILNSISFQESFTPFGIEKIVPPNIVKAKQTQTTQKFKIHLMTSGDEDLFTKVEFSRRGVKEGVNIEPVADVVLRKYKLSPLVVPHYDIYSTINQKINALVRRSVLQARDIFDLYILLPQYEKKKEIKIESSTLLKAYNYIFTVSFEQFRDTLISYLPAQEQNIYNNETVWDEIKLRVANFIEELRKK